MVCDEQVGSKSRPTPDQVTLNRMGDHIGYELQSAASGVSRHERDGDVLALEAGLLHTRALIEFLVGRPRRNARDVCPTDYQPAWEVDAALVTRLRAWMKDIDRYLSHLSLDRGAPFDPNEPPPFSAREVVTVLLELMTRFCEEAGTAPEIIKTELRVARQTLLLA
jgi:hypothetical protein